MNDMRSTCTNTAWSAALCSLSFVIYSLLLYVSRDFRGMEKSLAGHLHVLWSSKTVGEPELDQGNPRCHVAEQSPFPGCSQARWHIPAPC